MIDSPTFVVLAEPTDLLASNSPTWARGFRLEPATPRLIESIASVYRDFAAMSKTDEDRAHYAALAEKWGGWQP